MNKRTTKKDTDIKTEMLTNMKPSRKSYPILSGKPYVTSSGKMVLLLEFPAGLILPLWPRLLLMHWVLTGCTV